MPVALGLSRERFEQKARFTLAAKLFELGRLSSRQAARLAGMERVAFLLKLEQVGVSMLNLGEAEMGNERRYVNGD